MISTRSSHVWCVEPGGSGTSGIAIDADSVARGIPGTISHSIPRRSSARSSTGSPRKSESGLPSTPSPRSRSSTRATKPSITSPEPRRNSPWSAISARSIATPSLSRKRTSSGGASTVAARPTARSDSRLPKVRRPGSPGPSPTMRITVARAVREAGTFRLPPRSGLPGGGPRRNRRRRRGRRCAARRGGRPAGHRRGRRHRRRERVLVAVVADVDLRGRAELLEEQRRLLLLLLLRERLLDLVVRARVRRLLRGLLVLDLDDVVAERRLHGADDLPGLGAERGVLELRDHLPAAEVAQLAALVLGRRIGRVLLRQRVPVAAGLHLRQHLLRGVLVGDQDMARLHLLGLVEHRVVLVEVRLDVALADVDLRRERLLEDDLALEDVLDVLLRVALLLDDLLELAGLELRLRVLLA